MADRNELLTDEDVAGAVMPYVRAFGAGVVDPLGIPSWGLQQLAQRVPSISPMTPETADWYARTMREARAESPVAAGAGTMILPWGGMGLAGRMTAREMMEGLPLFAALGGNLGYLSRLRNEPLPESKRNEMLGLGPQADDLLDQLKYYYGPDAANFGELFKRRLYTRYDTLPMERAARVPFPPDPAKP